MKNCLKFVAALTLIGFCFSANAQGLKPMEHHGKTVVKGGKKEYHGAMTKHNTVMTKHNTKMTKHNTKITKANM